MLPVRLLALLRMPLAPLLTPLPTQPLMPPLAPPMPLQTEAPRGSGPSPLH